jgi:hypothetical protein
MPPDDSDLPLVSCILPTYDRRDYLPHALHYFLRQDYPNAELLVIDDGPNAVDDLIPDHPLIRYLRLPHKITLGAKLNLACAEVVGSIIVQWDDDDWYAPSRISRQVEALEDPSVMVTGLSDLLYYDIQSGNGFRYVYPASERPWLLGSSLCFRRELWQGNMFADVDVGMDGLFVWATSPAHVRAVTDATFAIHLIHQRNVSPKSPFGSWWSEHPVESIARIMGDDWRYYEHAGETRQCPRPRDPEEVAEIDLRSRRTIEVAGDRRPETMTHATGSARHRNVYACLVHESPACVADLVRNLRHTDPEATVLLYNGGSDPGLLADPVLAQLGAVIHPSPRPMRWGRLHEFALDCMRFTLMNTGFETMTIFDSDQLAVREGWSAHLGRHLAGVGPGVGLLGNCPERQLRNSQAPAALTAWQEHDLWLPYLRRFPQGESKFVHWTFWPSTVFTAEAARALLQLFDEDKALAEVMARSQIWATEEVLLPTLTALLGFRVIASPSSYDHVRYRVPYSEGDLDRAFGKADTHFIHPVPRHHDDPVRASIRRRLGHYQGPQPTAAATTTPAFAAAPWAAEVVPLRAPRPVVDQTLRNAAVNYMRSIRGWLADAEADLLAITTGRAVGALEADHALVEVGSFCGKATSVLGHVVRALRPTTRVYAIDPHDGIVGAVGLGLANEGPTLEPFSRSIAGAGLSHLVETVRARASDVSWSAPICFLLVDGLHDYENVARDFRHFEPHLDDSALVAFHDYAHCYPGVQRFVDELIASGRYEQSDRAETLIVLRKTRAVAAVDAAGQDAEPLRQAR